MARSGMGEVNTDGYYYQLHTLMYCIQQLDEEGTTYKIGKAVDGYGSLDDVVFHVNRGQETIIYALQVKQAQTDKEIGCDALMGEISNKSFYLLKYFKSFLALKKKYKDSKNTVIQQLILWTHMELHKDVQDIMEEFNLKENDLLKPNDKFFYERYRFKNPDKFKKDFIEQTHPFRELVEKFVTVLFRKEIWSSKGAAKSCFRMMAKEVILCNGKNSTFREEFMEGNATLSPKTLDFRRIFECAMEKRFKDRKIGVFEMRQLNSKDYGSYFALEVDSEFKENIKETPTWKIEDAPNEQDVRDFFDRLVFYVKVPKLELMKDILAQKWPSPDQYSAFTEIIDKCTKGRMISSAIIEKARRLVEYKGEMSYSSDISLIFEDLNHLEDKVTTMESTLYISAPHDEKCTVVRTMAVVRKQPADKRCCLAFKLDDFKRHKDDIASIATSDILTENGLKFIIISGITPEDANEIEATFRSTKVKIIFIAPDFDKFDKLVQDSCLRDCFQVDKLGDSTKQIIRHKMVTIYGERRAAGVLFGDQLFNDQNFALVLELYWNDISLGGTKLELDANFIARPLKEKSSKKSWYVNQVIGNDPPSRVLISDEAGMGKSTEMINLTLMLRERYQDCLVISIECKSILNIIKCTGRDICNDDDFIDVLCRTLQTDGSGVVKKWTKRAVQTLWERKKIILLLDGYDEVSDKYTEKIQAILKQAGRPNVKQLFIATRPQLEDDITKQIPSCNKFVLEPFSREDQKAYLLKFWKAQNLSEADKITVETNAVNIIDTFRSIFKSASFLGVPLQTHMIAVIYSQEILSKNFTPPKSYQIGKLFEDFVDKQLCNFLAKNSSVESNAFDLLHRTLKLQVIKDHIEIAGKIFFRKSKNVQLTAGCHALLPYGLVRLQPTISFTHQTYLEYFVALYVLKYATTEQEFQSVMERLLATPKGIIFTKFLDYQIENVGPSMPPMLLNECDQRKMASTFEAPTTARLHRNKMSEFNHFLECLPLSEGNNPNADYTLIRCCLNVSALNVVEVLYDSLPVKRKTELRLVFGNANENAINLKRLGCAQLLQLLQMLQRKHPDSFVERYLTNFPDQDEDFVAVVCRKPFVEVLRWFFELIPELPANERTTLNQYLLGRLSIYLGLVVQHNNSELLQEILTWVKGFWEQQTVAWFLSEYDVLRTFVQNIDKKTDNKPFLEDKRIEMVHAMHNMFTWAYDNPLPNSYYIDLMQSIQTETLKSAFSEAFIRNETGSVC